ncbi:TPA: RES family NAD+ phosphorylase [Bacillus cereus]|uniref:RES family NAD+ phosphorylase n=1 Tax=Bacillus cereus TaxID=1396 RepID=UPI0015970D4F|nr:RES family NAD+ phosphorylase [Bacillus cereus]
MSYCCEKCFIIEEVVKKIQKDGQVGDCSYCSEENVKIIEVDQLREYIVSELVFQFSEGEGGHTLELWLTKRFSYLNPKVSSLKQKEFLKELLFFYSEEHKYKLDYKSTDAHKIWTNFKRDIRENKRFFSEFIPELTEKLSLVLENSKYLLNSEVPLYRARIGEGLYVSEEMLCPPPSDAKEGRVNPRGIPYLYTATDEQTALTEVRPWLKSTITLAKLHTHKELNLIDFTGVREMPSNLSFKEQVNLWTLKNWLNNDFSLPINPFESYISYLSTQYVSEYVKSKGYDGIVFNSSLKQGGRNIVIFNQENVFVKSTEIVKVNSLDYDFKFNRL